MNIGILCANAPVFRTLYLYFQGKSQMQRLASPSPGVGKERVWPSNARLADRTLLQISSQSHNENRDASVSLEMGLPTSQEFEELGPLQHKARVGMGEGG